MALIKGYCQLMYICMDIVLSNKSSVRLAGFEHSMRLKSPFERFILVILLPGWPDELARNEGRYSLRGKPTKHDHFPNIILCDIEWLSAGLCFRHAGTAILSI